jgi:hypothetical protein
VESVSRREAGWLAAILLLASALRLFRLGTYPFWQDEIHNLVKADHIGDVLFRGEYVSNHPPLYPILAAAWRQIAFGDPEWSMRMLPALLGVLTVGAVFWTSRLLFGSQAGLFTAFLVAISPAFVTHSQDFKEYMILPLTGTLAVGTLYLAATTNRKSWWVAYTVCAALACYSESFAGPLLIALNLWYMMQARRRLDTVPGWVVSNITAFALFAPYLPFLLGRADKMLVESSTWWIPAPTPVAVVFYVKTLSFGYSALDPHYKIALVLFASFFVVGCLTALKQGPRATVLCIVWFIAPITMVYALSLIIESIFLYRAMLPFAIPFYLLIAVAWNRLPGMAPRAIAAGVFAVAAVPGLWQHYFRILHPLEFPHRPGIHAPQYFQAAATHIQDGWREGDGVVCAGLHAWLTMHWYGLNNEPLHFGAVGSDFIRDVSAANVLTTNDPEYVALLPHEIESIANQFDRVWYVYAEWERLYLPGNATSVLRWLDVRFPELDRWLFEGGEVRLYDTSRPSEPFQAARRDRDDGVGADIYASTTDVPYRLVLPDSGLVASDEADRRGRLRLSFEGDPSQDRMSLAQTDQTKSITFSLANVSDISVECRVFALAVDALVDIAQLREDDKESDVWRVSSHHNPSGNPANYDRHTAVAIFDGNGGASVSGDLNLLAETYDSLIYTLGVPGDETHSRANLAINLADRNLIPEPFLETGQTWRWIRGEPITIESTPVKLSVQTSHLLGQEKSFADVGYVGFIRQRDSEDNAASGTVLDDWPGDVNIAAETTRKWTVEVDTDMGRIDVWVWERGPDGKAYHIFEVYNDGFSIVANP